eukprot:4450185-Lingulodinium_polyedra.AAC.1
MAPSAKQPAKAAAGADPASGQGTAGLAVPKGPPHIQQFAAPAAVPAPPPAGPASAADPGAAVVSAVDPKR